MTSPDDLDIEGNPIGPMTAAEFRVVREYLGLTTLWLADRFGVTERTVHRWEKGDTQVPEDVREGMEALEAEAGTVVGRLVDACNNLPDPQIHTYRTDRDFRAHQPDAPWPASWHRAVVARVAQEVIGLEIHYWRPGES